MRPLRVMLVDDEPLARARLRALLQEGGDPASEVIGEAGDADAAQALLRERGCDLLLLDIGLPGRDGMRLAAALRGLSAPPSVVFVTAHAEHALHAFELDAVDYLTKPVSRERLRSALQRVAQRRRAAAAPPPSPDARVLVVHDRGRVLRLPLADVLYLKAELKYVTLRTAAHSYVLDDALADLEQRLGGGFLRVHRNALVARAAVRALQRRRGDLGGATGAGGDEGHAEHWAVQVVPTGEWLAVSRRQLAAVREALGG
ncbi:MAG TPA: LytTR family DNA-binding domain-containing protein [Rubrivivax sp.]|nr:LytTR family DNA-binding domain-containing protein [Rubrivivax sp.]